MKVSIENKTPNGLSSNILLKGQRQFDSILYYSEVGYT